MDTIPISRPWPNVLRVLPTVVAVVSLFYLAEYLFLALARMGYPFELEWIEGAMVDSVRRLLAGQPLYVEPSPEFAPFIYTPLYFWLAAVLSRVLGIGFLPLRLLSFIASLGCFWFIYRIVWDETRDRLAGLTAAGSFAAMYRIGGAWLDIARIDSLFLFFVLAFVYVLHRARDARGAAAAGILLFLAFWTKQAALLIAAPVLLVSLVLDPKKGTWCLLTGGSLLAVAIVGSDMASHGWFRYYVFSVPATHHLLSRVYLGFWINDLLRPLPILCVLVGYHLARPWERPWTDRARFLALAVGMVGSSYLLRLHPGGYNNVLLPAYAGLAVGSGLALSAVLKWREERAASGGRPWVVMGALLLCLVQYGLLFYPFWRQVPTQADRAEGERVLEQIRKLPGDVYLPYTGNLPVLAGKRTFIHMGTLADIVIKGARTPVREKLIRDLAAEIRARRFSAIITPGPDLRNGRSGFLDLLGPDLNDHYTYGGPLVTGEAFVPVTGSPLRPEHLWLRREGP